MAQKGKENSSPYQLAKWYPSLHYLGALMLDNIEMRPSISISIAIAQPLQLVADAVADTIVGLYVAGSDRAQEVRRKSLSVLIFTPICFRKFPPAGAPLRSHSLGRDPGHSTPSRPSRD